MADTIEGDPTWARGREGFAYHSDGTGDNYIWKVGQNPSLRLPYEELTVLLYWTILQDDETGDLYSGGITCFCEDGRGFSDRAWAILRYQDRNDMIFSRIETTSGSQQPDQPGNPTSPADAPFVSVLRWRSGGFHRLEVWADGAKYDDWTAGSPVGGNLRFVGADTYHLVSFGASYDDSGYLNHESDYYCAYAWSRCLSDEEIARLAADPFGPLRPVRLYSVGATLQSLTATLVSATGVAPAATGQPLYTMLYNIAKGDVLASLDLDTDDVRLLLVDDTYVFEPDEEYVTELSSYEVTGTGYTRKAVGGRSIYKDDAEDEAEWRASKLVWGALDVGTVGGAVLYKHVTDDTDSPLIAYVQPDGVPYATSGGTVELRWAVDGILRVY
jgi:hypothetical protein